MPPQRKRESKSDKYLYSDYMRSLRKWLKVVLYKIEDLEKRLEVIEEFLGGRESMKKILESKTETLIK